MIKSAIALIAAGETFCIKAEDGGPYVNVELITESRDRRLHWNDDRDV